MAYLLLLGIYGLYFELTTPGFGVPGVAGSISLLLGMFALQMLPVSYAGVALIVLGFVLLVAEALLPSFGAPGVGGTIAFVIGSVMLIDTDTPGFGIPPGLIATVAILGKHELDQLLAEREKINQALQQVLDVQTDAWGIKVSNVEIACRPERKHGARHCQTG